MDLFLLAPAHPIRTGHIRRRKQAHRAGDVQQPKGSEDEVMQSLEFQAMTHQAGRRADSSANRHAIDPHPRQKVTPGTPKTTGAYEKAAPMGYRFPFWQGA